MWERTMDDHAESHIVVHQLRRLRSWHQPIDGMGYDPITGEYGRIDPACSACGTPDEYAVSYPCPTAKSLDSVLSMLVGGVDET